MREIKFRGRNSKHNKRLYGDLFRSRGQWFITQDGIVTNPLAEPEDWRVEPETVGQSTGLTDKNHQEMCAGDIIYCELNKAKAVVKYNDKIGQYRFYFFSGEREDLKDSSKYHGTDLASWFLPFGNSVDIEIIGNIHENPELINR